MGKTWGYARVSSDRGQSVMLQVEQLTKAGCHHVFEEAVSGNSREGRRAQLKNVLGVLSKGDSLVVTKLDRLGRNTRDVLNIVHEVEQQGAHVQILEPAISTEGDIGRIVITVFGMVAEMERNFIRERQRSGIDRILADPKLKAKKYQGRKIKNGRVDRIMEMRQAGLSSSQIANKEKCSQRTVFRILAGHSEKRASD